MNYQFQPSCQIPVETLDRIYTEAFGVRNTGLFVEIGAHDGWHWSNTWGLAEVGWEGFYVEPVPALWEECLAVNKDRPLVQVINCAVGNANTVVTLGVGEYGASLLLETNSFKVQQFTLDHLLATNCVPYGFDLLVIDVEGGEAGVLEGFDLQRWMPRLVIIERPPVPNEFTEIGYRIVYKDDINTVYSWE